MRKLALSLFVVLASANLAGCGYNKLQNQDEAVKAAWSEVVNQYQRRADLIPNLVTTVKGYAAQEERVLVGCTEARAKATSIQLTPELINDPAAFAKFQAAQGELTQALKSLLVTVENYPDLKSDAKFRDLQVQLEGTENRITVARNRYIEAVQRLQRHGARVSDQPHREVVRLRSEAEFHGENEAAVSTAPAVSFDTSTPSQPANSGRSSPKPRRRRPRTDAHREAALLPLAFAAAGAAAPPALAQIPLPKLEARVTDLTGTLTAAQQSALEEKLTAFEARKGAQIAVLILPTTEPEDIAQFGVRLMESWKLGRKGVDDGAALIVAKEDRELRIEVQYGLEGVLTDATSGRIINETIVPLFKQGDFYGGINAGVDQMLRVVDGEPMPEPDQAWKAERRGNSALADARCLAGADRERSCCGVPSDAWPAPPSRACSARNRGLVGDVAAGGRARRLRRRIPAGVAVRHRGRRRRPAGGRVFRDIGARRRLGRRWFWWRWRRWWLERRRWTRRRRRCLRPLVVSHEAGTYPASSGASRAGTRRRFSGGGRWSRSRRRSQRSSRAPAARSASWSKPRWTWPDLRAGRLPARAGAADLLGPAPLEHRTSQWRTHLCIDGGPGRGNRRRPWRGRRISLDEWEGACRLMEGHFRERHFARRGRWRVSRPWAAC